MRTKHLIKKYVEVTGLTRKKCIKDIALSREYARKKRAGKLSNKRIILNLRMFFQNFLFGMHKRGLKVVDVSGVVESFLSFGIGTPKLKKLAPKLLDLAAAFDKANKALDITIPELNKVSRRLAQATNVRNFPGIK